MNLAGPKDSPHIRARNKYEHVGYTPPRSKLEHSELALPT